MPKGTFTEFEVRTPSGRVMSPYAVQLFPAGDGASMKASLDIPPADLAIEVTIAAPRGLQEYTYVMVGTLDATTSPPMAPRFTFRKLLSPDSLVATLWPLAFQAPVPLRVAEGSFTVVARRRRVYCNKTPLYLEVLWHPTTGETISLHGLEKDTRKSSVDRAYRGITLLKVIEAVGGRPPNIRYYLRDEFHAAYPRAYAQAERRRGARPRDADIAQALNISLSAMRRYLREYGRPVLP